MKGRLYGCAVAIAAAALGSSACNRQPAPDADGRPGAVTPAQGTVAESPRTDDASITMAVQSRFFGSDIVKGRDIDVDTESRVVTLKGTVDSDQEKQEAVQIARDIPGVARVDDQLRVEASGSTNRATGADDRSSAWITAKIQSQYYLNPGIKPWNIDVATSADGSVRLSGRVESAADRAEAVRIARTTDGVTRVDDQLRVEARGETAATTGTTVGERATGEANRAADRIGDAARGTADRVGDAASRGADRAESAASRAGDTAGRQGPESNDGNDGLITAKIQSKYFLDTTVKGRKIDVDTKGGVVTLRGTVDSPGERIQAVSIARATDGVGEVRDQLRVEQSSVGKGSESDRQVNMPGRRVDDAWVTTRVQSKFFMHDEIRSRTVDVTTRSGVVTLAGTVPSEAARSAAEELARDTDGVTRVVNKLTVRAEEGERSSR